MDNIDEIIKSFHENEAISRKFFDIEVRLLTILNFKDLFERLLTDIKEIFAIPYVWISLIDDNELIPFINELYTSEIITQRLNIISKSVFLELTARNNSKPVLIKKNLRPFFRLFPKGEKYLIRSLAIIPISLNGRNIGSLNCGDTSDTRFLPGMDTVLLERLAIKVSLCLSNVTAHEKLKSAAARDPLTGLLNRRVMDSVLKREYKRADRYSAPLSLIFFDLDNFKNINDRYGHDTGDLLLKYFGVHLVDASRENDVVTRFAGDEFVVILPSTDSADAIKLATRLKTRLLENPLQVDNISIPVSVSFGVASLGEPDIEDSKTLLKKADKKLYEAKKTKNRDVHVILPASKHGQTR